MLAASLLAIKHLLKAFRRPLGGILFLTTNRASNIDPAVRSRITVALHYEPLSRSGREAVWANLLQSLGLGNHLDIAFFGMKTRKRMKIGALKAFPRLFRVLFGAKEGPAWGGGCSALGAAQLERPAD